MSKILIVVALLGLASLAVAATQDELNFAKFNEFSKRYEKQYKSLDEFLYRYGNFLNNLEKAAKLNKNGDNRFGITKFMDLSVEEFKQMYTGFRPNPKRAVHQKVARPLRRVAPSSFDWRDKDAVSPVKDQGQCGSCWAFSTVEEIESMWFLKNGTMPILSPQQIVDCDTVDQGCNGGDTPTAYAYVKQAGGLESDADYPYTAVGGTCAADSSKFIADISGFEYATPPCTDACTSQDENTLKSNLASRGPVSICVDAEIWQTYTGGVIEPTDNCAFDYSELDHCVQLVGYNTDSTGTYWIVRNSWNTNWGEDGYIYLRFGSNVCGVADEATFADI